jgi:hypothetical protein
MLAKCGGEPSLGVCRNWYEKQPAVGSISDQFLLSGRLVVVQYGNSFRYAGIAPRKKPRNRGGGNEENHGEESKSALLARRGTTPPDLSNPAASSRKT